MANDMQPKYLMTPQQHRCRAAALRRELPNDPEALELATAHEKSRMLRKFGNENANCNVALRNSEVVVPKT